MTWMSAAPPDPSASDPRSRSAASGCVRPRAGRSTGLMPQRSTPATGLLNGIGSGGSRGVSQSCYKVEFAAKLTVRPHRRDARPSPPRGRALVRARPVGWRPPAMSHHALRTSDTVAPLRFLDVGLIVLAAPFVAVAGLPL